METLKDHDFWVECGSCGTRIKNHMGSTGCCAAISYLVDENGNRTNNSVLLGSTNGMPIVPLLIPMR